MLSTAYDASTPSLHPRFMFHDLLRIALFLIVPIYARFCIEPSVLSTFGHVYVIGTTGVCIVHFSSGTIDLALTWDIIHGLLVSSFPCWSNSLSLVAWIVPNIGGWRGEIVYWAFVATHVSQLLPNCYGSDVQMLRKEYNYAYPHTTNYINIVSVPVVYCAYWRKDYPWYHVLTIWAIISSCIEYAYLAYLNYRSLHRYGKTVRQNSWPYKDMLLEKSTWPFKDAFGREFTIRELIYWHATGSVLPRD